MVEKLNYNDNNKSILSNYIKKWLINAEGAFVDLSLEREVFQFQNCCIKSKY